MLDIRTSLFDDVKESCRRVTSSARHVRINESGIAYLAENLMDRKQPQTDGFHDPARHFYNTQAQTVEFIMFLNAVNFGSGFRDDLREEGVLPSDERFYACITQRLKEYVDRNGIPSCDTLLKSDIRFFADIFNLPPDRPNSFEFLELIQSAYKDYARYFKNYYDASAWNLFEESAGSARHFVEKLIEIPSYNDFSFYDGRPVYFYKRAQITAADLFFALQNQKNAFHDIDQLTAFADPALPQVLRYLDVLDYSDELNSKIEAGIEIKQGSEEEVEIRAATIEAIENIKGYFPFWRVIDIDDILWWMAGSKDLCHYPRHKTKTVFY